MSEKIYVPQLDLHSPVGKRMKSSRSMNHHEEIGYFSPNHHILTMTSRHVSPIQHCQQHQIKSQSKNSEYYTKRKCKHCCKSKSKCKDCCKTTSRTPVNAKKYSNRNYPMDYLDYQPETFLYKSFLPPPFDYRLPQIPTLDNYQEPKYESQYEGYNKQYDMYTQTQMNNNAFLTQQNKHKNARKSFELNPILLINQQHSNNQHKKNEHMLQADKIEAKQKDEIKKRTEMEEQTEQRKKRTEKLISFGENETNHNIENKNEKNSGNNLIKNTEPIIQNVKEDQDEEGWKKERNEQSRDYKKTFSEAILDELFEKDERKQVQEKYNKENKYSEVIIGKVQKTVEIKQNTHSNIIKNINSNSVINRQSTDINQKKQSNHNQKLKNEELQIYEGQNSLQHKREYFGDSFEQNIQKFNTNQNINRYGQKTSPYNSKDPINPHLQIKANKQLRAESTVNMLINRNEQKGQNFRNSTAQTAELSSHGNNNNQVSQTDNSQSHLVLERLLRNYVDDAEFRRRINQKRDQFNRIKIQFEETPQIGLQELINSKDSYIQYSQEFLSRLNHIIEDTTLIQRKKIQSYHSNRSSSSLQSRPSSISLNPQRFPQHLLSMNYLQVPLPPNSQLRLPNQYKINVPVQNDTYVQQPVQNYLLSPSQNQHHFQTPSQIYFQAPSQVKQSNQSFPSPKPELAYPPKLMHPVARGQPINSIPHPNPSQIIQEVAYKRMGKVEAEQNKIFTQLQH